ncbi:hypothetical protein KVA01_20440 [Kocuria varians]|uniref:Serine aminopeptidase S33 domain-containing protein n=1 Tax=Kocuria varians TaxID=1272 RepID=A0A4Y4D7E9_KOCVA|nr:alpha/beta hydrolase [Kocuria varians]GEC99889.1 hypothetical protein KVA01_20440 [Kocuria varians]
MQNTQPSPASTPRREDLVIPVPASEATVAGSVAGTLWLPEGGPSGVVVLHPATATPERFYAAFAEYVTGRGLALVTYDYRGTGRSGDPREHRRIRMRDWMAGDVPAVAAWTRAHFPDPPVSAVGHSVGGHAMVLGHGLEGLDRFAVVSSHLAFTARIKPVPERMRVAAMLHVAGPTTSRALGYLPGRKLGIGEDMPTGAMVEWGSWARRPGYFFDDPRWTPPPARPRSRSASWHWAPRTTPGRAPSRCSR